MHTKTKVSAQRVLEFYKELDKYHIENHALIMMRDGEVLFENYVYPYSADMPHTLFSVTKSIVSTAAGIAIEEGLLTLDTKIIDIFPEYPACESDEWENVTLRSVLTMQSNKEFSFTQDMTGNYAEMFMAAPFRKKDRGFLYSNNDAHIVAAAVQKRAGMSLVEYLTPRLFEPLGIDKPFFWETNSVGENIGGTGCYLKLIDLAKICQCYADGGKWQGRQVIPEWWTKEATKLQVVHENGKDGGYGYLFWITNGRFSMDGMFGQRVTYIPDCNAVIASFNACVNDPDFTTAFETILPKAFVEECADSYTDELEAYLNSKGVKPVACTKVPKIPTGKTFYLTAASDKLANLLFPASLIPRSLTSSFAKRPKSNLDAVSFDYDDDVLVIRWKEEEDNVVIRSGLDGTPRMSECTIKGYPYKIWSYAYINGGKFTVVVKPINTLSTQYIEIDFDVNEVSLRFTSNPCFVKFIKKNAADQDLVKKSGFLKPTILSVVEKFLKTTQLPMKFKAK